MEEVATTAAIAKTDNLVIWLRMLFPPAFPEVYSKTGATLPESLSPHLASHVAKTHPLPDGEIVGQETQQEICIEARKELGRLLQTKRLEYDSGADAWTLSAEADSA